MSNENKTMLAIGAGVAGLLPLIIGLVLGWPTWLWLLLMIIFLGITALIGKSMLDRAEQERLRRALLEQQTLRAEQERKFAADQPAQYQRETITNVVLPSAEADYEFLFSATVQWRQESNLPGIRHANPAGLAVDAILRRAREVTALEPPSRHTAVQHRLSSVLGAVVREKTGLVEAFASDVSLGLSDGDLARLERISNLRKDEQIWEQERDHERNKRAYLGEDVLRDTGRAIVWWLSKKDTDIERAVELIVPLAKLVAAANNTEVDKLYRQYVDSLSELVPDSGQTPLRPLDGGDQPPNGFRPDFGPVSGDGSAADMVHALMNKGGFESGRPERALVARRLAKVMKAAGAPDVAAEIEREFGSPHAERRQKAAEDHHELAGPRGSVVTDGVASQSEDGTVDLVWQPPTLPDGDRSTEDSGETRGS